MLKNNQKSLNYDFVIEENSTVMGWAHDDENGIYLQRAGIGISHDSDLTTPNVSLLVSQLVK